MDGAVDQAAHVDEKTDEQLVELAAKGDHAAFGSLVEARLVSAFRTASAVLGNEADARDVVQEAFVSAWVNMPRLRDPNRFDAWLNRILVNRCHDVLRRRGRAREIALDDVPLPGVPDETFEMSALNAAFERLPVPQRHLLVLHHLHQEPVAEIAKQLRVPVGTAKWRLYSARRALERALEAER